MAISIDDITDEDLQSFFQQSALENLYSQSDDLSEKFNITKYNSQNAIQFISGGSFPVNIIPRSDQPRIQNLLPLEEIFLNARYEVTLKLDGSSFTAFYKDGQIQFCSRNNIMQYKEKGQDAFSEIFKKYDIQEKLQQYDKNIAIQGELIGPRIQNNHESVKENDLYIFDIYDIDQKRYLTPEERYTVVESLNKNCNKGTELKHVPVVSNNFQLSSLYCISDHSELSEYNAQKTQHTELEEKTSKDINTNQTLTIEQILQYADGPSMNNKDVPREGLVFKSTELMSTVGKKDKKQSDIGVEEVFSVFSFKVISNKYLS